jgi:hypothetical protein
MALGDEASIEGKQPVGGDGVVTDVTSDQPAISPTRKTTAAVGKRSIASISGAASALPPELAQPVARVDVAAVKRSESVNKSLEGNSEGGGARNRRASQQTDVNVRVPVFQWANEQMGRVDYVSRLVSTLGFNLRSEYPHMYSFTLVFHTHTTHTHEHAHAHHAHAHAAHELAQHLRC